MRAQPRTCAPRHTPERPARPSRVCDPDHGTGPAPGESERSAHRGADRQLGGRVDAGHRRTATSARATTAAMPWLPPCSTSTTSATRFVHRSTATVPPELEDRRAGPARQLPRVRHHDHGGDMTMTTTTRPVHRLGHRLRPHRRGLGRRPVPDLGRAPRAAARSPTPTATAACGCPSPTRTSPRSPTTPSTSRPAASWSASPARRRDCRRRSGIAPPITSRPALPPWRAAPAAARRSRRKQIDRARAVHPATAASELLDETDGPAGRRRRRRGVRPAHPGAGDRPHARLPRARTPTASAASSTTCSKASHSRRRSARPRS